MQTLVAARGKVVPQYKDISCTRTAVFVEANRVVPGLFILLQLSHSDGVLQHLVPSNKRLSDASVQFLKLSDSHLCELRASHPFERAGVTVVGCLVSSQLGCLALVVWPCLVMTFWAV